MPCGWGTEGLCMWEPLGRKLKGWCDSAEQQRQTAWPKYADLFEAAALMTEKASEQRHLLTASLSCNAHYFPICATGNVKTLWHQENFVPVFQDSGTCSAQSSVQNSVCGTTFSAQLTFLRKALSSASNQPVSFLKNNGSQVGKGLWKSKGGRIYLCKTCSAGYSFWSFLPVFSLAPVFGPIRWAVW